jgi:hypothetical protein
VVIKVICHECGAETKLSLVGSSYDGLFRCWKCKRPHIIVIENDEITYCRSISDEKNGKQLEMDFQKPDSEGSSI